MESGSKRYQKRNRPMLCAAASFSGSTAIVEYMKMDRCPHLMHCHHDERGPDVNISQRCGMQSHIVSSQLATRHGAQSSEGISDPALASLQRF